MTTDERHDHERRLKAHLSRAKRSPLKREQHLRSAAYYAQLLGVELPNDSPPPLTAEIWVQKNPEMFFVAVELCARRCALCNKRIDPNEQYFGMRQIKLTRAREVRFDRGVYRLHGTCAGEIR